MLLFADPVSHEQKLSESLDTALNSALSSMPLFTAKLMKSQQQAQSEGGCSSSWSVGTILGKQQAPLVHLWERERGTGTGLTGRVVLLLSIFLCLFRPQNIIYIEYKGIILSPSKLDLTVFTAFFSWQF